MEIFLIAQTNILAQFWDKVKGPVEFLLILGIIYSILYFLRGTKAISALIGCGLFLALGGFLAEKLEMKFFSWMLGHLSQFIVIGIIVIFQPELRSILAKLGSQFSKFGKKQQKETIEEIAGSVTQMSFRRCGALIVFERKIGLAAIVNNAVQLDTKINSLLVQSLFYPKSPLHDGAVIIRDDKIVAAHAILPLAMDTNYKNIGTRHRAAIGITEETDAVAVIVSEETGTISAACRGKLVRDLSEEELLLYLKRNLLDIHRENPAGNTNSLIPEVSDADK